MAMIVVSQSTNQPSMMGADVSACILTRSVGKGPHSLDIREPSLTLRVGMIDPSLTLRVKRCRPSLTLRVGMAIAAVLVCAGVLLNANSVVAQDAKPVSYHKDVLPILRGELFGLPSASQAYGLLCHGPTSRSSCKVVSRAKWLLVAKDPTASHLLSEIIPKDGKAEMPKGKAPLTDSEIDIIRRWIAEGAVQRFASSRPRVHLRKSTSVTLNLLSSLLSMSPPTHPRLQFAGFHEILVFR